MKWRNDRICLIFLCSIYIISLNLIQLDKLILCCIFITTWFPQGFHNQKGEVTLTKETDELVSLRDMYANTLIVNSKICIGLSALMKRNKNVGIDLHMFDGGATLFPPSTFNGRNDQLSATIFVIDHYAGVYLPGSTCQINVAHIGVSTNGINPEIEMENFNPWDSKYDKILQYKGPKRCGNISSEEVAKIFSEIQEDIREIFNLPR